MFDERWPSGLLRNRLAAINSILFDGAALDVRAILDIS
jgi:hypothetical protein